MTAGAAERVKARLCEDRPFGSWLDRIGARIGGAMAPARAGPIKFGHADGGDERAEAAAFRPWSRRERRRNYKARRARPDRWPKRRDADRERPGWGFAAAASSRTRRRADSRGRPNKPATGLDRSARIRAGSDRSRRRFARRP